MVQIFRCNSEEKDFINLAKRLDEDLEKGNGDKQSFYQKFNKILNIDTVILLKDGEVAVGCGCFKEYDEISVEIKRMYLLPAYRGIGYAKMLLGELEHWAKELGYHKAVLETGSHNTKAVTLYQNYGYHQTKNYGQYANVETSVCFEKLL